MASLVMTRVGQAAQFVQAGLLVGHPEFAGVLEVVRDVVAEDLQGPVHAGAGGHGGLGGAAEVGVVEVGQPVGGGADLLAHPAFLPHHQRVVGAHPGQQGGDGVAVADDHPVHSPDFAGLRLDAEPAGRAHERQRGLGTGAGDLHGRGPAGFGQGTVGQEGAAPDGLGVGGGAVDDGGRQPAHGASAAVQEAGLAGQRLAVADHPHHVPAAAAQSAAGDHDDFALVAVHLGDGGPQPARRGGEVHLRLDDDPAGDDVQAAGEAEHGGDLGLAD